MGSQFMLNSRNCVNAHIRTIASADNIRKQQQYNRIRRRGTKALSDISIKSDFNAADSNHTSFESNKTQQSGGEAMADGKKWRVLLVDDDDAVRELYELVLGTLSGTEVLGAPAAAPALELMAKQPFDLLVTDVMMPQVSGIELLRLVKEKSASLPALVISGVPDVANVVASMKLGASDFLVKPFTNEELLVKAKALLEEVMARRNAIATSSRSLDESQGTESVAVAYQSSKEEILPTPLSIQQMTEMANEKGFFDLRKNYLAIFDRVYLSALLERHDGDVTAAARDAQLPRGTLYRLMNQYGIVPQKFRRRQVS
jgi:DNA-binding NtrC family response regulator